MSIVLKGLLQIIAPIMAILCLGLLLIGGGLVDGAPIAATQGITIPRETVHSNNHVESDLVMVRYNARMCDTLLAYYSSVRGTLLFLCGLPQTDMYGGLIYRITENNGQRFLGDESYKVSVFVDHKSYWNTVILRDSYSLFGGYSNLQGLVKNKFPGLYW